MSRAWTAFRLLLAAQVVLAGWAASGAGDCGACRATGSWLALAGFALYASMLAGALAWGPSAAVFGAALFAAGVHAVLVAHLWIADLRCGVCAATAVGAALLAVLAVACDRGNLARGAAVVPWAVLAAVAAVGWPRPAAAVPAPADPAAAVRLTVFTQADCPYCDRLRDEVMPALEKEFGARLRVVWRPAADLPAIRRTPTVVVAPERNGRGGRVFEGLPTAGDLRDAIRSAEGRP
ncbi:MAG TPA: hypothetical protein VF950_16365 [Planctomycetota bacterium]